MNKSYAILNCMKGFTLAIMFFLLATSVSSRAAESVIYFQDFDKIADDKIPDDIIIVDGKFSIKSDGKNKYLQIDGTPIGSYGILIGKEKDSNTGISARFYGESTGKRHPSVCVGLFGISGIKLRASPGRKSLELLQGEQIKNSIPFEWKEKKWLWLNLTVRKSKENIRKITVECSAYYEGEDKKYVLKTELTELPPPGKPSLWGIPFSSKPILVDDVKIMEIQDGN